MFDFVLLWYYEISWWCKNRLYQFDNKLVWLRIWFFVRCRGLKLRKLCHALGMTRDILNHAFNRRFVLKIRKEFVEDFLIPVVDKFLRWKCFFDKIFTTYNSMISTKFLFIFELRKNLNSKIFRKLLETFKIKKIMSQKISWINYQKN